MKFVSFINQKNEERLGIYLNEKIADLSKWASEYNLNLPSDMNSFLEMGAEGLKIASEVEQKLLDAVSFNGDEYSSLLAPVPHPPSCRDAYAFRQHVAAARKNRGVDMIPEFDQFPIFYFTNHKAIIGEGDLVVELDHLEKLDFELELCAVIGKKGRNITASSADEYIIGYTIMNDFSARQLQMEEMKLNLGPAKGKDFATAIGPWLVTKDELEEFKIKTPQGDLYKLEMKAFHNGEKVSQGNSVEMYYTFAEIIERVSYGVDIYPGDIIGSGTVGTGCYLELNGTWIREAEEKDE